MDTAIGITLGLGLAAAAGLRVFVPLLLAAIAVHTGHLEPASGFGWLGSTTALVIFGTAALVETLAYFVPWLDHALDTLATPAAAIAGAALMAAVAVDLPGYARWPLAIIAGGGLAGLVQAASVGTRALSTVMTAGFGNPVVAAAETGGAVALGVIALLLPVLGLVLVVGLVAAIVRAGKRLARPLA
jgi:hypothetical protein